jgi:hypothetical protein
MNKRLFSAGLWSFAALYAGSVLHGVAGTSELLGPIVGLTTAAVIVSNPVARLNAARTTRVGVERPTTGLAGKLA